MELKEIQDQLNLNQEKVEELQTELNKLKNPKRWVVETHRPPDGTDLYKYKIGGKKTPWTIDEQKKVEKVLNNEFLEIYECREAVKKWLLDHTHATVSNPAIREIDKSFSS